MCDWYQGPDPFAEGHQAWLWRCCQCRCENYGTSCRACDAPAHPGEPEFTSELLIVGSARGATKYAAELLRAIGLAAGHEVFSPGATVSTYGALFPPDPWLQSDGKLVRVRRRDVGTVVHQVRHPLSVIRSWQAFEVPAILRRLAEGLEGGPRPGMGRVEYAARYWLAWSHVCDLISTWRYRVEAMSVRTVQGLCHSAGVLCGPERILGALKATSRRTNATREHRTPELRWSMLRQLVGLDLADAVAERAARYGY